VKRQFFTHGFAYAGANLISSLSSILLVPIYTHALPPADYGVVDFLVVVQTLVQICAGLEITQGIARFFSGAATEADRREYASTGLWFLLASFATVCVLLYLAGLAGGAQFLGLGARTTVFAFALTSVYARILFYALQSQLRWELRSDLYSVASLVTVAATVSLVAYLLLVRHDGLRGVFMGLTAGYGAGCAFCLFSLRHTYRWLFDREKFGEMLRFSLPLTFSSLALFCAAYGDRIILKETLGFHDLGIYGIGARLAAAITLVINGFQLGAAPLIYRHHGEPDTPAALAQLLRLFLAACLIGVASLATFSIELLRLFTTPEYAAAWRLIPVLALAMVVANLYVFVPGLTIRNMTTRFAAINIATGAITLGMIAALLRLFGVVGAAAGVLCGAAAGFAMHAAASQRVYRIPIEWRRLAVGLLVTLATIAIGWTIGAPGVTSFGMRALLFAGAAATLVAALSTGEERTLAQRAVSAGALSAWSRA